MQNILCTKIILQWKKANYGIKNTTLNYAFCAICWYELEFRTLQEMLLSLELVTIYSTYIGVVDLSIQHWPTIYTMPIQALVLRTLRSGIIYLRYIMPIFYGLLFTALVKVMGSVCCTACNSSWNAILLVQHVLKVKVVGQYYAVTIIICDRTWENRPLGSSFRFRDIGTTLKRAFHSTQRWSQNRDSIYIPFSSTYRYPRHAYCEVPTSWPL